MSEVTEAALNVSGDTVTLGQGVTVYRVGDDPVMPTYATVRNGKIVAMTQAGGARWVFDQVATSDPMPDGLPWEKPMSGVGSRGGFLNFARQEQASSSDHFEAGDVTCECGRTFHLWYNGGELDQHLCECGIRWWTEHELTVLKSERVR